MNVTSESDECVAMDQDNRPLDERALAKGADRTELGLPGTIDLRKLASEEAQILAATGC